MSKINIGKGIRHARESIGITQEQMAEVLGVTKETISNYENNRTVPDIITLCKMSYVCELPIDYITDITLRRDSK